MEWDSSILKQENPMETKVFIFLQLLEGRQEQKKEYYKGLYKDKDGTIHILGFEELYAYLKKRNNNVHLNILGEKLKKQGISYLGEDSSAIIAADSKGKIKSGEIVIDYNDNWLINKTNEHLSKSNILVYLMKLEILNLELVH